MKYDIVNLSKFLSLILRHLPEKINIKLDENGWANVEELIKKIRANGQYIDMEILEKVVQENDKKRFAFNEDKTKIRANQGHTIKVDVELKKMLPPQILYHGTKKAFLSSILAEGLKKGKRLYVHLSKDVKTAKIVADRRMGENVLLKIDAEKMSNDGFEFYLSENEVWLCEYVPTKYISIHK